jgi:hypothetical protein
MPIYWEKNASGVQKENSNIEEDNERCQLQKPHMKNDEDKEQVIVLKVNIVFNSISKKIIIVTIWDLGC